MRSAAGKRGATKYMAMPASASTQCTISHADTRSRRTISAPTANAAQPMATVSMRLSSECRRRVSVSAATTSSAAPTIRSANRALRNSVLSPSGASAPIMWTAASTRTRPARNPCRRDDSERRAASASAATAMPSATSSQGRSRKRAARPKPSISRPMMACVARPSRRCVYSHSRGGEPDGREPPELRRQRLARRRDGQRGQRRDHRQRQ